MKTRNIASNFIWRLLEREGAQVVGIVISIILARLLEPTVYGIIALVNIFLVILQVFVDSGLETALVQKKNADQQDFSSVFFFNIFMSVLIYALLFACAPLIARFYNNDELVPIVRCISIVVLFSGVKGIQQAYVSRNLLFKKFFYSTLIGTLISAIIGIIMAYLGYGVWALITQSISNTAIDTFILWITVKWRPTWEFSYTRLKGLLTYGWKILMSSLVTSVYGNLRQLLIGKFYTAEDLAYYNKGNEIPNSLAPNIVTSITSVLLPTVAQQQDDLDSVKRITRKAMKAIAFAMWPVMIGIAACGETLVVLLLTDKWFPCVRFLQIFCIEAAIWPISAILNNSAKAIGRSDVNLKIQMFVRMVGVLVLVFTIQYGPFAIAITAFLITMLELCVVSFVNKKLINYKIIEQLIDILPSFILSLFMATLMIVIGCIPCTKVVLLTLQVIVGVSTYLGMAYLFRNDALFILVDIFKILRKKHDNG